MIYSIQVDVVLCPVLFEAVQTLIELPGAFIDRGKD